MSAIHKIISQEVFVRDGGVTHINTRCPKEFITDAMIENAVEWAKLHIGDTVGLRVFNHEKTEVLHFTEYLVAGRLPQMRRVESFNGDSQTKEIVGYTLMQTEPWTATPFGEALEAEAKKSKKAA